MAKRKESLIYLDTHVVAWLYDALTEKLSEHARDAIERSTAMVISPMVRLELQYLKEIGRIRATPASMLAELRQSIGLKETERPLPAIIDAAMAIHWTRDSFDRLIVAEAQLARTGLVTKDARIREHFKLAVW